MKKIHLLFLAMIFISAGSFAQKGKTYIGVGADISLPTGDFGKFFRPGIGFYTKAMFGAGKEGQVTFTGGYSAYKEAGDWEDFTATTTIAPLLAGYRHNFNGFFVEPQIGYAVYGLKINGEDGFESDTKGAFTWAASAGYVFDKKFEVSARYQSGGTQGLTFPLFGLRLGYNFSVGSSK